MFVLHTKLLEGCIRKAAAAAEKRYLSKVIELDAGESGRIEKSECTEKRGEAQSESGERVVSFLQSAYELSSCGALEG